MTKKFGLADSPFFLAPASPTTRQERTIFEPSEQIPERTEKRTEFRSETRTEPLPVKRRTKRYSFEFYEDQLTKLKQLKYEAEMGGEQLTLSDIAREALDLYLQDK